MFVDTTILFESPDKSVEIFLADELVNDCVLLPLSPRKPCIAKVFFVPQDRTCRITFEFLAFRVFKVELHGTAQAQKSFDLDEAALAVALQSGNQGIPLQ